MSFLAYRRLFYALLCAGLLLLLSTALVSYSLSPPTDSIKRTLTTATMLCMSAAFMVYIGCGLRHKRIFSRGGATSFEEQGKNWFTVIIALNAAIVVVCIAAAVKSWTGAIPIFE